jgi:thioredoxin-related protein
MTREVYSNSEFIEFSRKYVMMRVFQDTEPQANRLASRFRVEGFPTLLILDYSGHEIGRILGFRNAQDLIDEIGEHTTKDDGRISL